MGGQTGIREQEHMMSEREIILWAGVEGGGIKLFGIRLDGGWRFQRNVVDQTPLMLDEEEIRHDSMFTSSWEEALALLDRYPWHRFSPIRVHPEFRQAVWAAVEARYTGRKAEEDLERWRDRCAMKS